MSANETPTAEQDLALAVEALWGTLVHGGMVGSLNTPDWDPPRLHLTGWVSAEALTEFLDRLCYNADADDGNWPDGWKLKTRVRCTGGGHELDITLSMPRRARRSARPRSAAARSPRLPADGGRDRPTQPPAHSSIRDESGHGATALRAAGGPGRRPASH